MQKPLATMVIGTVEGYIHDLGLNIVSVVFSASGLNGYNLNHNFPADAFIKKAKKASAGMIIFIASTASIMGPDFLRAMPCLTE